MATYFDDRLDDYFLQDDAYFSENDVDDFLNDGAMNPKSGTMFPQDNSESNFDVISTLRPTPVPTPFPTPFPVVAPTPFPTPLPRTVRTFAPTIYWNEPPLPVDYTCEELEPFIEDGADYDCNDLLDFLNEPPVGADDVYYDDDVIENARDHGGSNAFDNLFYIFAIGGAVFYYYYKGRKNRGDDYDDDSDDNNHNSNDVETTSGYPYPVATATYEGEAPTNTTNDPYVTTTYQTNASYFNPLAGEETDAFRTLSYGDSAYPTLASATIASETPSPYVTSSTAARTGYAAPVATASAYTPYVTAVAAADVVESASESSSESSSSSSSSESDTEEDPAVRLTTIED